MSVEKLLRASNYRSWRRSFEIGLASKRKLGFVTGTVKRDATNTIKQEAWDTCNNMIISWILNSVSESIRKSVMFLDTAHAIWNQLEKRFSVVNGARKYKLNKELYSTKQGEKRLSEYYIEIKAVWEELESLNALPVLTNITNEVQVFLTALSTQQTEQKLFQFLNGLDESYSEHRSHILLVQPLPSVDEAYNLLQQEESQRDVLLTMRNESDTLVMYGKSIEEMVQCSACGKPGHSKDKCWTIVGYPSWHNLSSPSTVRGRGYTPRGRGGSWPRISRRGEV